MRATVQTKEIKDAILDATDKLLARYGYQKMTIDDIAAEVGIGKGSIYLHFKSKEEIALSHVDRIIDRLCEKLRAIADSSKKPDQKIREMALARVTFRFDSVQHYTKSINELLSNLRANLLDRRAKHHECEASIFADVIKEGQDAGLFVSHPPAQTSEAFIIATNSLLPFGLSAKELGKRSEIEAKALSVVDLLIRGITK